MGWRYFKHRLICVYLSAEKCLSRFSRCFFAVIQKFWKDAAQLRRLTEGEHSRTFRAVYMIWSALDRLTEIMSRSLRLRPGLWLPHALTFQLHTRKIEKERERLVDGLLIMANVTVKDDFNKMNAVKSQLDQFFRRAPVCLTDVHPVRILVAISPQLPSEINRRDSIGPETRVTWNTFLKE